MKRRKGVDEQAGVTAPFDSETKLMGHEEIVPVPRSTLPTTIRASRDGRIGLLRYGTTSAKVIYGGVLYPR